MKRTKRMIAISMAAAMLFPTTAFAGTWQGADGSYKYQNDDGTYAKGGWHWIDGNGDGVSESYYFNEDGMLLQNTTTPDNYQVDASGAWVVDGVVQTQSASQNGSAASSDEFPLKGRVEKYFGIENGNLVPYWQPAHVICEGVVPAGMTGMTYIDNKAVEERDISILYPEGGYNLAVLAILADYRDANIPYADTPEVAALLAEVKEFMNSFDWKNASDLEKATRICNRIHKASYDHDAANEARTTGWSESPSYGAYGCLVNGKAVCQGYTEAANLLAICVGLQTMEMGDVGHTYPLFLVDGIWLANEPTTQDKYFTVADVYEYNPGYRMMLQLGDTSEFTDITKYQMIGQYCEVTGYTVPTELSELPDWAGKREETRF